jgi:hypothetical protein
LDAVDRRAREGSLSHAALPQIEMPGHETARMAQEQQSSASSALLDELQLSVSATSASGGCRLIRKTATAAQSGPSGGAYLGPNSHKPGRP